MNIRNKIKKASAVRNKESYIQAVNNRFGFKGSGTYIFTSPYVEGTGTTHNCITKEVKSYELKVVGNNNFWVITELDGTVIVSDTIEYTMAYYMRPRIKKAKVFDWKAPHKCFGYYTDRSCLEMEEADIKETEEIGDGGSYNRWRKEFVSLIKETFK